MMCNYFHKLKSHTGGSISPVQYRRKRPTQFQDFWMFEVLITNYFESMMNDVIKFKIIFLKSILLKFHLIAFGGVRNSTHFGSLL